MPRWNAPANAVSFDGSARSPATDREAEECTSETDDGGNGHRLPPGISLVVSPGEAQILSQNVNRQGDVAEDSLTVDDWKASDGAAASNWVVTILPPFKEQHGRLPAFDVGARAAHEAHSDVDLISDGRTLEDSLHFESGECRPLLVA
jgi:hypothetical protein